MYVELEQLAKLTDKNIYLLKEISFHYHFGSKYLIVFFFWYV